MEEAAEIFLAQIQPLQYLRQKRRLPAQVSALPHLFQGTGLAGLNTRGQKGKLVKRHPAIMDWPVFTVVKKEI